MAADLAREQKGSVYRACIAVIRSGFDEAGIAVVDLQERRQKLLIAGGTYGRYLPSGHLLYIKGGALFAVPFDLGRLEVRGKPVRILDGVAYSNANGAAQFDVAATGTLVYRAGGSERVRIEWLDASGATRPILRDAVSICIRPFRLMASASHMLWCAGLTRNCGLTIGATRS